MDGKYASQGKVGAAVLGHLETKDVKTFFNSNFFFILDFLYMYGYGYGNQRNETFFGCHFFKIHSSLNSSSFGADFSDSFQLRQLCCFYI